MNHSNNTVKAVLFDFDGTLTRPGAIDFVKIKKAIGCPTDRPILEFIQTLPSMEERSKALAILDRFEIEAARNSLPAAGSESIVRFLRKTGIFAGILTRNSKSALLEAISNFKTLTLLDFQVVISRDDPIEPKPSAKGVLEAARRLNVSPAEMLVVGDYIFDIQAGKSAGARTAYIGPAEILVEPGITPDFTLDHLNDIRRIIRYDPPDDLDTNGDFTL